MQWLVNWLNKKSAVITQTYIEALLHENADLKDKIRRLTVVRDFELADHKEKIRKSVQFNSYADRRGLARAVDIAESIKNIRGLVNVKDLTTALHREIFKEEDE